MSDGVPDDNFPRVAANRAALRVGIVSSGVVSLALIAGLLAQDGLFSSGLGSSGHPDPLTTLALVLAVLAFLVQIFVFVLQTRSEAAAVRRSDDLNAKTHALLGKIEANSESTQRVLISQFDRLLDFVVGGSEAAAMDSDKIESDVDGEKALDEQEKPVTVSELQGILNEALRPRARPVFEAPAVSNGPDDENREVARYMRSWPTRGEAESYVVELTRLPPLALAQLVRYGTTELRQRLKGRPIGLLRSDPPARSGMILRDRGLVVDQEKRSRLSEKGRDLVRMLPLGGRVDPRPDWFDEVAAPLWSGQD